MARTAVRSLADVIAAIQRRLPRCLRVQTFDGSAVAAVPFSMRNVRPLSLPTGGIIPDFLELNLRTYVTGPDGRTGVWFFSLECTHAFSDGARLGFSLRYQHAKMAISGSTSQDTAVTFSAERQGLRSDFLYRQ